MGVGDFTFVVDFSVDFWVELNVRSESIMEEEAKPERRRRPTRR